MVCIVVALYSEAQYLIEKSENVEEFNILDKKAYSFKINNKDIILAISGIGKVSAALTTQYLIDTYSPEYVLNFGTCGGMNNSVEILKYYAVERCCQFDFDVRELDDVPLGYIQEYKTSFFYPQTKGIDFLNKTSLATADRFTNCEKDISDINKEVNCSLRDMEGGAIAQVCTSNNCPLFMIKGISDVYGSGTAQEQFYKNLKAVAQGFYDVVLKAIASIGNL